MVGIWREPEGTRFAAKVQWFQYAILREFDELHAARSIGGGEVAAVGTEIVGAIREYPSGGREAARQ
ncbi:hypothetical protein D3C83_124810 [compost metagenome]